MRHAWTTAARPGYVDHRIALAARTVVLAALVAGCVGVSTAPVAVQPTLAAIAQLGYGCDGGIPDNVPSGLYEWHCERSADGPPTTVLMEGNHEGVASVTLVTDDSTDFEAARAEFARLVSQVPPMSIAPVLGKTLTGWRGEQLRTVIGGVRVFAECATQCVVIVSGAANPTRPMPLP